MLRHKLTKTLLIGGALGGVLIGVQAYNSQLENINNGIKDITIQAMEQAHAKGTTKKELIKAQEKIQQLEATLKQGVSTEQANEVISQANNNINEANNEELEVISNLSQAKESLKGYIQQVDKASVIGGGELPKHPTKGESPQEEEDDLGGDLGQEEGDDLSPSLPPHIGDDHRDEEGEGAERPERPTERPTESPQGIQ